MNVLAVRPFEHAAGSGLVDKGTRDDIAGAELHLAGNVLAQVAVAFVVGQMATLTA